MARRPRQLSAEQVAAREKSIAKYKRARKKEADQLAEERIGNLSFCNAYVKLCKKHKRFLHCYGLGMSIWVGNLPNSFTNEVLHDLPKLAEA